MTPSSAFDLARTYMHLGLGATVEPLVDFQWDTADVHEPGQTLFITPGRGTEHRPR